MKIHGHPQKSDYLSPAEWPTVSCQGHWQPAIDPDNPTIGHIHFDITAPLYAEVSEPFTCLFAVHLFKVKGEAKFAIDRTELVKEITWDATGTTEAPRLIGDPLGEKVWTGKLTIDPAQFANHPAPKKGFFIVILQTLLFFANGDSAVMEAQPEFYSMLDPTAEETPSFPYFGSHFSPFSSRSGTQWGVNLVDVSGYLPLAPIDKPWNLRINTAGYGAKDLSSATYEQRADLDLHHDIPGRLLDSVVAIGDISRDAVLDPGVLGLGPHKMAFFRTQPDKQEMAATLVVFKVDVGAAPPFESVVVPNVVGLFVEEAHTKLTAVGLGDSRTDVNSSQPIGNVVAQSPVGGTTVGKGTVVALSVSKGNVVETWKPVSPMFEQLFDNMGNATDRFRMTANGKTKEV
jgi:hypothetical protein